MALIAMKHRAPSPTPSTPSMHSSSIKMQSVCETPTTSKDPVEQDMLSSTPTTPGGRKKISKKLSSIRKRMSVGKTRKSVGGGGGAAGSASPAMGHQGGDQSVVSGEGTDCSESGTDMFEGARSGKSLSASQLPTQPPPAMGGALSPRGGGKTPTSSAGNTSPIPQATSTATTNTTASSSRSLRNHAPDPIDTHLDTIEGSSRMASSKGRSPNNVLSPDTVRTRPTVNNSSGEPEKRQSSASLGAYSTRNSQSRRVSPQTSPVPPTSSMLSPLGNQVSPGSTNQQQGASQTPRTTTKPQAPFRFVSDDNFTRRVDSYDGQVITCSDSRLPTYEVGNYLGGGVAGVVYEGKRLRPVHEYPPVRVRGGGAFYPNSNNISAVGGSGGEIPNGPPVAMSMSSSSLSSIRRQRSASKNNAVGQNGPALFTDVYRAVVPHKHPSNNTNGGSNNIHANARASPIAAARGLAGRGAHPDDQGGCTSFLFGNCGFERDVDDRSTPLASTPANGAHESQASTNAHSAGAVAAKERYQAVDMASIEVPAAFSSMEQETTPTAAGGAGGASQNNNYREGFHHVVVDDADAPNRSKREARALSRNNPQAGTDQHLKKHGGSFVEENAHSDLVDGPQNVPQTHLIEDMSETVAIKILNPVAFRLLDPETLHKAVIVREGTLPKVEPNGSFVLKEEHVWWLVNPNSRNLRSLLRKNHQPASSAGSSMHLSGSRGMDDASEESSLKRQQSLTQSLGGGVDRGSPERGLRLSLVATFVDPSTNTLRELPLPRCVEIWGHPPFGATDEEFEAMMDVLLRLNAGAGGSGGKRKSSSRRGLESRSRSNMSRQVSDSSDPLASRRSGSTVFCPALSAYIAVPAVPPKYLRWLKQRRLATKEVRNMMRIGRHNNVVHLYEVLEMVQESKSTMFLILELVRGGELFDLISSNSSSKRKNERAGGGKAISDNELHEVTMRKFFSELASGIYFIHSCGVAHRDLKPENLLIHTKPVAKDGNGFEGIPEEEKTLKIADFGLSAAFLLHPPTPSSPSNNTLLSSANTRMDDNSTYAGAATVHHASGLPMSPQSNKPSGGLSPLLNRVGATALSMLTCGSMTNVCIDEATGLDSSDLVDDGYSNSIVDLRRMTSVVGSPHYVAPEIIAQADKGSKTEQGGGEGEQQQQQDRKARHALRAGYDGTKADVWSAGVILYAMLFRSLPFGEDLLRCPRYQAFQKWFNDARQLVPPQTTITGKRNRRAFPEHTLDPDYDEFDEEEMLGPHWFFPSEISLPGRDLIVAMLNPNPNDRISIEMVLQHPWLMLLRQQEEGLGAEESHHRLQQQYHQQRALSGGMPSMTGLCISGA